MLKFTHIIISGLLEVGVLRKKNDGGLRLRFPIGYWLNVIMIVSLWNLTGICLSNFRANGKVDKGPGHVCVGRYLPSSKSYTLVCWHIVALARNIWLNYEGRRPEFTTTRKRLWRVRVPRTNRCLCYGVRGCLYLDLVVYAVQPITPP